MRSWPMFSWSGLWTTHEIIQKVEHVHYFYMFTKLTISCLFYFHSSPISHYFRVTGDQDLLAQGRMPGSFSYRTQEAQREFDNNIELLHTFEVRIRPYFPRWSRVKFGQFTPIRCVIFAIIHRRDFWILSKAQSTQMRNKNSVFVSKLNILPYRAHIL